MFISVTGQNLFLFIWIKLFKNNPNATKCKLNAENVLALAIYYLSRFVYLTSISMDKWKIGCFKVNCFYIMQEVGDALFRSIF